MQKGKNMSSIIRTAFLLFLLCSFQTIRSEEPVEKNNKSVMDPNVKILKQIGKFIRNTTWVVPPSTLLAYEYLIGISTPVSDQTVWVINRYNKGYFFGDVYTSINQTPTSQLKLVGSVTPNGDVYITFYPVTGSSQSTDVVKGIGKFGIYDDKPFFIMQMNSAENNLTGLSHWSYMISVKPGDPFYQHLPGENMSVPEFINQFN
jgi:hypothetical protein